MAQKSLFSFFRRSAANLETDLETDSSTRGDEEQSTSETTSARSTQSSSASSSSAQAPSSSCGPPGQKKLKRDFREDWKKEFPWLIVDSDNGGMLCRLCIDAKQKGVWTKGGSKNYQHSALKDHAEKNAGHLLAVATMCKQPTMDAASKVALDAGNSSLKVQLRTVLYMAKNNVPSSSFTSLIELQQVNGCPSLLGPCSQTYVHHDSVDDMEKALADVTKMEIKEKLQSSQFIGLMTDETLNCTLDKKLIVYARILCDGKVVNVFLGNYTIDNGTAECVYENLVKVMEEWGIPADQLSGFGSDGASVMTGHLSGVGVRLKQLQPALVHVHCVAHRVALAAKDATNNINSVSDYRLCLQQLYKLYKASGDRTHRLRALCDVLQDVDDYVSLKHPISVRWLSLGKAVTAVRSVYPALVLELEEEARRGNASADGLLRKCKMYSFVAMTYMLSDTIPIMEKLNLTFQEATVNLSTIQPMVKSTQETLQTTLANPGHYEQEFAAVLNNGTVFQTIQLTHCDRRPTYERARGSFIQDLIDSLSARFPDDQLTILSALAKVFDAKKYPARPQDRRAFAIPELTLLSRHYATIINGPRAMRDFEQFKSTVAGYPNLNFEQVCLLVVQDIGRQYPDFATLATIALTIPVSSVPCERGFSLQNQIKTDQRSRLSEARVSRLMTLHEHAPGLAEFDFDAAATAFQRAKKRRK